MHFTIKMPEGVRRADIDTSPENGNRIQQLLTEASRTWADRLIGSVKSGAIGQTLAEHYAAAFPPEVYKQAFTPPAEAIGDIAIIEELQDNTVKLVFAEGTGDDRVAKLTWYLGGRSASLSELLPMLQCMGVVVLEERPFTVIRADGLPVWIYQSKCLRTSPFRQTGIPIPRPPCSPRRSPRSGRAGPRSTGSTNWCCVRGG